MVSARGINQVLAAVLLAVVVAALILGVYLYYNNYLGSRMAATKSAETTLGVETGYYDSGTSRFVVFVSNLGNKPVELIRAYIKDPTTGTVTPLELTYNTTLSGYGYVLNIDGSTKTDTVVNPGEAVRVELPFTNAQAGVAYTIVIVGNDGSEAVATVTA